MIFTTDAQGEVTYICLEWFSYAGQTREAAYRDGWTTSVLESDQGAVRAILAEAAQAQAEFSVRFRIRCADGSVRWLAAGGVPSFGPPGRSFLGYLGSMIEFAPTEATEIAAYGGIERFVPPPTHVATQAVAPLDTIADHLIIVHALMEQHDVMSGLKEVKGALFRVGQALARGDGSRSQVN
ncbi:MULTISPECIES: PAS domain-containing protein [unclassified Methylobacterium]|uniref:PAS domain-containing protein n=1 Tax=unclassified Methylobacterium TaxID=2615210 RepID=UPI00164FBCC0|nr:MULTISPECIES: PAS domain-containing protein [unclassified Methylobacterium]MCJ2037404.1 PAS domain-containing protein [Methylobacterium sp. J-059]MCJ2096675.1 PAS domain-containing protein [Methylobacterium sp. J-072]MCJ2118419.1 PAS domain-containing protein [Methylobacterium sp. J-001]